MPRRWLGLVGVIIVAALGCKHAPPPVEPIHEPSRIWIASNGLPAEGVGPHQINVRFAEELDGAAPIVFECEILCGAWTERALFYVSVTDERQEVLYEGGVRGEFGPDSSTIPITWDPASIEDGTYTARFELLRPPLRTLASHELTITKVTIPQIKESADRELCKLAAIEERLDTMEASGIALPYARVEAAVARDCGAKIRACLEREDWLACAPLVRHVAMANEAIRTSMAFYPWTPELSAPVPSPDEWRITLSGGTFHAADRVVFPFGITTGHQSLAGLSVLPRYGLRAAAIQIRPANAVKSGSPQDEAAKSVSDVIEAARENGLCVALSLGVESLPNALDSEEAPEKDGEPFDIADSDSLGQLSGYLTGVARNIPANSSLLGVSLMDQPRFKQTSRAFRRGFVAATKEYYKSDLHRMNSDWRMRLRQFSDITVDWQETEPAYLCDLAVYQEQQVFQMAGDLADQLRAAAPGASVMVTFPGVAEGEVEAASGIDRSSMADRFDVNACATPDPWPADAGPHDFTGRTFQYALLRSIAPERPVIDMCQALPLEMSRDAAYRAHTIVWEAVVAGAAASFTPAETEAGALFDYPDCIGGFARASRDINRLASIVAAFQREPAHVAILWSESSRRPAQGDPYLGSVQRAYKGCASFGYKIRFITEEQCVRGDLDAVGLLVIPKAYAATDEAFTALNDYINSGKATIRTGEPMPYTPRGKTRADVLAHSTRTVLIPGDDSIADYLHAMDAASAFGGLPAQPRAINAHGYPLEGVTSRFATADGEDYLYLVNKRSDAVAIHVSEGLTSGRDLIAGRWIRFPYLLDPFEPMLVRLGPLPGPPDTEPAPADAEEEAAAGASEGPVSVVLRPVTR